MQEKVKRKFVRMRQILNLQRPDRLPLEDMGWIEYRTDVYHLGVPEFVVEPGQVGMSRDGKRKYTRDGGVWAVGDKEKYKDYNDVINVNLNGVYNVTNQVLPLMPDGGRVISISSICGISGNFGQCNYSATKAALIGFTKSLSKELGKHQITVNAVAPGFIESAMTEKIPLLQRKMLVTLIPLGEMGQMQDIANTVAFLASDKARYISGEVIRVDGGMLG